MTPTSTSDPPYKRPGPRTRYSPKRPGPITVSLTDRGYLLLVATARRAGVSRSDVIEFLLRRFADRVRFPAREDNE